MGLTMFRAITNGIEGNVLFNAGETRLGFSEQDGIGIRQEARRHRAPPTEANASVALQQNSPWLSSILSDESAADTSD
jgi:hypothetical protein